MRPEQAPRTVRANARSETELAKEGSNADAAKSAMLIGRMFEDPGGR
jgi:hypothetical protein